MDKKNGNELARKPIALADPLLSICIPAYNRAKLLGDLLDSIITQNFDSYEIVISEDASLERKAIRAVVERYIECYPGIIRYFENHSNLGYDGNLRQLISKARGQFLVFFGNDDIMAPQALSNIAFILERNKNVGVIIRSYAVFEGEIGNLVDVTRYFPEERLIPAGPAAVVIAYRRSVVISGLTIRRREAERWATDSFDGTLLYQLYIVANVLCDYDVVFTPEVLALYRTGGVPDFGNAPAEQGTHLPREQTVSSSIAFMTGMLQIARHVEAQRNVNIMPEILRDIANYSLPVLLIQADRPILEYFRYFRDLGSLGFGRFPAYYLYFISILILRPRGVLFLMRLFKKILGVTPYLGRNKLRRG